MPLRALTSYCLVLVAAAVIGCGGGKSSDGCDAGDCSGGSDLGVPVISCDNDGQCMSGLICVGGACAPGCHSGRDCPTGQPICDVSVGNGQCVGCRGDADCAPTEACVDHACHTRCRGDGECSAPTPRCDPTAHLCVACVGVADCPLGTLCKQGQCRPGCGGDRDCPTSTPRCDPGQGPDGTCVACFGDGDCAPGQLCHNHGCVSVCSGDSECPSGHCDTQVMVCVECTDNTHCPLGNVCALERCVPGCATDRDCPVATPHCDPSRGSGVCLACVADGDCPGGTCKDGACMMATPPGMVAIAAGVFTMGDNAALSQAGPEHPVMLSAYAIDKTEVTNDAYRMCVAAGACPLPSNTTQYSDSAKSNVPVVYVDHASATAYCAWAGKRLPTEAEWEKAARGTDKRKYPWGAATASCALANGGVGTLMNGQCQLGVVAVGSYPDGASPYGVLDLSGNAREWVYDWDGTYPSASSMVTDPGGPQTGSKRQTRGGSYFSLPEQLTTAARLAHAPEDSVDSIGFRCARGPTPRPKVVPTAVLTVTPTVGSTSTVFNADASQSTDPIDAAATLQVRWKFGDGDVFGPFTTAKTTTHHYAANGSYPLTVEVRNSNGYTAQAVRTVTVNANGSPPDMAGGAGEGQSCATDTDCVVPLYCYQGQCRQICGFIGGSCPAGFTCSDQVFGYCLPTGG